VSSQFFTAKRDIDVRDSLSVHTQAREIRCGSDLARGMLMLGRMRLAVAAASLLLSTTAALAQPGATSHDQQYGPPQPPPTYAPQPAPYAPPQPAPYAPPQPAPNYGAPQPQPYSQPAPYAPPEPAPNYGAPQPQPYPQPYPQQAPQPYPQPYGQPNPGAQPYAPQYSPRPYYSAQPYSQPPIAALTRPATVREIKKPGTAQLLAVGATGLGLLAVFGGADDNNEELALAGAALTLIGPSAGHIYAGENGHAVKMTLLRTAGLLTFAWGAVESTQGDCIDYCYEDDSSEGETAMYLGGAVFVIGTLYDLYDSGRAARRYNEKAARALTLGPTMMSSARGGTSPGVALSGSF